MWSGGAGRLHRCEEGNTETRRVGGGFWMKAAATEGLRHGRAAVRGWKEPVVSHTADSLACLRTATCQGPHWRCSFYLL